MKVDYCIVCEDVRPEINNKLSILGFFGIAPNVIVVIKENNTPTRLTFMISFVDLKEGAFSVQTAIHNPNGSLLNQGPVLALKTPKRVHRGVLQFPFLGQLPSGGLYRFTLARDGQEIFKTTFQVFVGDPASFPV